MEVSSWGKHQDEEPADQQKSRSSMPHQKGSRYNSSLVNPGYCPVTSRSSSRSQAIVTAETMPKNWPPPCHASDPSAHGWWYIHLECFSGHKTGGAGVVITDGDTDLPWTLEVLTVKGAPCTASNIEEVAGMKIACEWMEANSHDKRILTCTDSLSMYQSLVTLNEGIDHTIKCIAQRSQQVAVQWVPAHVRVPGNEAADVAAREAAPMQGHSTTAVRYSSACSAIRRAMIHPPSNDDGDKCIAEIYGAFSKQRAQAEIKKMRGPSAHGTHLLA